jgi:uncharacterized protein YndB with AHSA1/START domain
MAERSDGLTLELKRVVPAPPSMVFAAFSDPNELAKWWGPEGFKIPSLDFDPRVGKSYRIEMQPAEGDPFYLTGEFREVKPPARLAYTFIWEDPDPDDVETLVGLSFRDLGESTEVALTQRPFKTEARRALHRDGWTDSFDKLERLSAGRFRTRTTPSQSGGRDPTATPAARRRRA